MALASARTHGSSATERIGLPKAGIMAAVNVNTSTKTANI